MLIKKGDIVVRKSYSKDLIFKVIDIVINENQQAIVLLKGIDIRLHATAPLEDLEHVHSSETEKYWNKIFEKKEKQVCEIYKCREMDRIKRLKNNI